jgi:hypothetical protein
MKRLSAFFLLIMSGLAFVAGIATAQTSPGKIVHSFNSGSDGANPLTRLVADAAVNFYTTTSYGAAAGFGTIAGIAW